MTAAATITPTTTLGRPPFDELESLAWLALGSTFVVTTKVERGLGVVDVVGEGVGVGVTGGTTVLLVEVDDVERVLDNVGVGVDLVLVELRVVDVDVSSGLGPKTTDSHDSIGFTSSSSPASGPPLCGARFANLSRASRASSRDGGKYIGEENQGKVQRMLVSIPKSRNDEFVKFFLPPEVVVVEVQAENLEDLLMVTPVLESVGLSPDAGQPYGHSASHLSQEKHSRK
ncbi:hypothetical protein FRC17_008407 [Serendipita sp. 399]|nr:hypothetical protein FRC17_008407 [Serendipita sp. 399]